MQQVCRVSIRVRIRTYSVIHWSIWALVSLVIPGFRVATIAAERDRNTDDYERGVKAPQRPRPLRRVATRVGSKAYAKAEAADSVEPLEIMRLLSQSSSFALPAHPHFRHHQRQNARAILTRNPLRYRGVDISGIVQAYPWDSLLTQYSSRDMF